MKSNSTPEQEVTEPSQRLAANFRLIAPRTDSRYFLVLDWLTHPVHSETSFDGTNCYRLCLAPLFDFDYATGTERSSDRQGCVIRVGRSSNGIPEDENGLNRLAWLALASGRLLWNSNPPYLSAPWAASKGLMPERDSFRSDAQCFKDALSLPQRVDWRFSQKLWDKESRGKAAPVPLTNGLRFAWYSVLGATNCDGASVPTEFCMTRLATRMFAYAEYHGLVTNIARVAIPSFVPDPKPYQDGVTVHDARLATPDLPELVVAYNLTNAPYPSESEPWLQARVEERRLKLIEEKRRERLKRLLVPFERLWNAIRGTK